MIPTFAQDAPYGAPRVPSTIECANDSVKMDLFKGTNCLICPVCQELRWLV